MSKKIFLTLLVFSYFSNFLSQNIINATVSLNIEKSLKIDSVKIFIDKFCFKIKPSDTTILDLSLTKQMIKEESVYHLVIYKGEKLYITDLKNKSNRCKNIHVEIYKEDTDCILKKKDTHLNIKYCGYMNRLEKISFESHSFWYLKTDTPR